MKLLLVLSAVLGLAIAQNPHPITTEYPPYNCTLDHRAGSEPGTFEQFDGQTWILKNCTNPHLIFNIDTCMCEWPDKVLTYGNCSDVNRPSQVHPSEDYMYEYWHPIDNVWYEKNCHDAFPSNVLYNNEYLFFNVTGCRCDWKPGHPPYLGPPVTADCTLDMDIAMDQQPPMDSQGSFVQPDCPVWKVWPPKVALANEAGRECMRCEECTLKSWFLKGSGKKSACFYFGVYSTRADNPSEYRVVLADSCASIIVGDTTVYNAWFLFEYRASPVSFRVTYHGGQWTGGAGGNGVDNWVDVALCYRAGSWFTLYQDGNMVVLTVNKPPAAFPKGVNPFLRLSNYCQLNICGDPLNPGTKYTGCVHRFQLMAGGMCPNDTRSID